MYRFFRHRHFWRGVGFDELSEIYVSMMFRGLAISLTGLFIPLYMLRLGYGITDIAIVAMSYFLARTICFDVAAAYTTARVGPKHTMIIGNLLLITSTIMFLTLGQMPWPTLLLGAVWGGSASFFFIPFHVDFSKVKHKDHGGKELGYVNIMEKVGFAVGPLAGGLIATVFGGQYIFLLGTILLIVGLIPLFQSGEPVKQKQKLDWRGLDIADMKYDFLSYAALGIENTFSIMLWPLYLGIFVLVGSAAYAELGALSSISVVASILSAMAIGKLIDNRKGRSLLRISTVLNAIVHVSRLFVTTYIPALATNLANETITAGYRMPYVKGMYDAADDLPGYRIVYITSMELFGSAIKGFAWAVLVVLSYGFSARAVMIVGFLMAAISSLIIMTERFRALD